LAEQQRVADLDNCIHQAAEALHIGRTSVAQTFFEQNAIDAREPTTDPRELLSEGRQSIIDQMKKPRPDAKSNAIEIDSLYDLNRQLGDQLAKLTSDFSQGRTRPEVFKAQLRATLDAYRSGVEHVVAARVIINVR
jgi:hypothetical protein